MYMKKKLHIQLLSIHVLLSAKPHQSLNNEGELSSLHEKKPKNSASKIKYRSDLYVLGLRGQVQNWTVRPNTGFIKMSLEEMFMNNTLKSGNQNVWREFGRDREWVRLLEKILGAERSGLW